MKQQTVRVIFALFLLLFIYHSPANSQTLSCPSVTDTTSSYYNASYVEGSGMVRVPAIGGLPGFNLVSDEAWTSSLTNLDAAIPQDVSLADSSFFTTGVNSTLSSSDLTPYQNFKFKIQSGFRWTSAGQKRGPNTWTPQGLAYARINNVPVVLNAWYYSGDGTSADLGSRVTLTNVSNAQIGITSTESPARHVLLVEPTTDGTVFKPVPIHAGGMTVVANYLYVVDTNNGLRVFNLNKIKTANTTAFCQTLIGLQKPTTTSTVYCAFNYKYILPQVNFYKIDKSAGLGCDAKFSFVGQNYSSGRILTGEYKSNKKSDGTTDPLAVYGRLISWPFSADGKLATSLVNGKQVVSATDAWFLGNTNMQGVYSEADNFFFNSTRNFGSLYEDYPSKRSQLPLPAVQKYSATPMKWINYPQGFAKDDANFVWFSNEGDTAASADTTGTLTPDRIVLFTDSIKLTNGETPPYAPSILQVVANDSSATVFFGADGGLSTSYIVSALNADGTVAKSVTTTTTPATLTGLTNYLNYKFKVVAVNSSGTSYEAISDSVMPSPLLPTPNKPVFSSSIYTAQPVSIGPTMTLGYGISIAVSVPASTTSIDYYEISVTYPNSTSPLYIRYNAPIPLNKNIVISNLPVKGTYKIKMRVVNSYRTGDFSPELSAVVD